MNIRELEEGSRSISHTYKVTPDVYYSFQRCSNDYNPLHTDQKYANDKGYTGAVMYGNILNAFISHFVGMLRPSAKRNKSGHAFFAPFFTGVLAFFCAHLLFFYTNNM